MVSIKEDIRYKVLRTLPGTYKLSANDNCCYLHGTKHLVSADSISLSRCRDSNHQCGITWGASRDSPYKCALLTPTYLTLQMH